MQAWILSLELKRLMGFIEMRMIMNPSWGCKKASNICLSGVERSIDRVERCTESCILLVPEDNAANIFIFMNLRICLMNEWPGTGRNSVQLCDKVLSTHT